MAIDEWLHFGGKNRYNFDEWTISIGKGIWVGREISNIE